MVSKHKFTKEQVEFLTLDLTLKRWAGKSMAERTMLFKRRYPYAHITMYKLRKLYREQRIKKKSIRISKIPINTSLPRI